MGNFVFPGKEIYMALSNHSSERGSAILFLFIAVALFGALAFAFTHGSRSSVTMLQGVQSDATGTATQDCTNTVNLAVKRLELRGCGNKISYLADGSNTNTDAPTDGSCSVFHPNGGGVKACNASAISGCTLTSLAIGESCDGLIYVGTSTGKRIYTTPANQGQTCWDNGSETDTPAPATSPTDGSGNTDLLVSSMDAASPYAAAQMCRALGPEWYLPSREEGALILSSRNIGDLAGTFPAASHWTSTEYSNSMAHRYSTSSGTIGQATKGLCSLWVRCVRSD